MINIFNKYLIDKLNKIIILFEVPGSIKARRAGIYFEYYRMVTTIKNIGIIPQTILDVGANRGMFSKAANFIFPNAKIIAFEPLKNCFNELKNLSRSIKYFECYNIALGESTKKSIIYRSSYDYSSSLLIMSDIHKKAYPYSSSSVEEEIQVKRLDEILVNADVRKPVLLKIDVQGYERAVINGANGIIDKIDFIICELSFVELYENQPLFDDMYNLFRRLGFRLLGYIGESKDPESGQILQIDALFIKK